MRECSVPGNFWGQKTNRRQFAGNAVAQLFMLAGLFLFPPASAAQWIEGQPAAEGVLQLPDDWLDDPITSPPPINRSILDAPLIDPQMIESDQDATESRASQRPPLWHRIFSDHRNYYDAHSFRLLAAGFLVGAAVANTQLDQEIQDHFQTSVRGASSDEWAEFLHANKELGDGLYTLPIFATAWATGEWLHELPVFDATGRWGERSLRSFLVGAPPLMLAQRLTGGSRPREKSRAARWLPLQDNNGVSGHSFMASLPFINAAKMTDNAWLKGTYYAGSLLGPLSRVNDNAHYTSQVALGWWMAYVAASAIDRSEVNHDRMRFQPYLTADGYGGMIELRF